MRRGKRAACVCVLVTALALAAPSACTTASAGVEAQDATHVTPEARRSVPFTTLDVALIVGGASGLIAAGAGLRRVAGKKA